VNPDTGHLVAHRDGETLAPGYEPVPAGYLSRRARRLLGGRSSVIVPQSDPLTRAMHNARKQRKAAEKKARKRNR
jgi:hypothetical protein